MRTVIEPCDTCGRFRGDFCHGYDKPRRADDTNAACPLFNEGGTWATRKAEGPSNVGQKQQPQRMRSGK